MTDDQQKTLIAELVAIRKGMATKADLLKLEDGLTGIIIKLAETGTTSATQIAAECLRSCAQTIRENRLQSLEAAAYIESYAYTVLYKAESVPSRTPANPAQDSSPTNERPLALWERREAEIEADIARLTERLDRQANWHQRLERDLADMRARIEKLENHVGSATQTEQTAEPEFMRLSNGDVVPNPTHPKYKTNTEEK